MTTLIPQFDLKNGGSTPTGAVNRAINLKLAETVSVKDFGAVGDGTTDDTVAIQNAVTDSAYKTLYFPEGIYKITATINIPRSPNIVGAGCQSTTIDGSTLGSTTPMFNVYGDLNTISGLCFQGGVGNVSNAIGIYVANGYVSSYRDLKFIDCNIGMSMDEAGGCLIENCLYMNCLIGTKCAGGSGYTFSFCNFGFGTSTGIDLAISPTSGFSTGMIASQCLFTSNIGINSPSDNHSFTADNCYFEGDASYSTLCRPFAVGMTGSGTTGTSLVCISNCRIAHANTITTVFDYVYELTLISNSWGQYININSNVHSTNLIGNSYYLYSYLTNNCVQTVTQEQGIVSPWRLRTLWFDNFNTTYATLADASNNGIRIAPDRLVPTVDNYSSLGDNVHRWTIVWATTGTIQTSDANQKEQILTLTEAEQSVAKVLKGLIRTFKFKDAVAEKNNDARIHCGVIAQDVAKTFTDNGLDPNKYGVFCSDTWYEVDGKAENEQNERYTKDTPNALEVTRLGVRYEELFAFIISTL